MPSRNVYYRPALGDADALAMAQEDWDAMVRRHEIPQDSPLERVVVRQLADAYIASNRSTMHACQLRTERLIARGEDDVRQPGGARIEGSR